MLIKNIISLLNVQLIGFLSPLLLMPIIIKVYGIENYGIFSFLYTTSYFLFIIIDYGFSLGAVKNVLYENFSNRVNSINTIITCQLILIIFVFILFFCISYFGFFSKSDYKSYTHLIPMYCVCFWLNSIWFYQCVNELSLYSKFQTANKVSFLIISLVISNLGLEIIYIFYSFIFCGLIFGLSQLIHVKHKLNLKFNIVQLSNIRKQFCLNFSFFVSKLSILSYTSAISIFIGFKFGAEFLGYYSVADKIRGAMQAYLIPITQVLYPVITNMIVKKMFDTAKVYIIRCALVCCTIAVVAVITINFLRLDILNILGVDVNQHILDVLFLLTLIVVPVSISNTVGKLIFIPYNFIKEFNYSLIFVSIITILSIYPISLLNDFKLFAYLYLSSEILVCFVMLIILYQKRILNER